MSPSRGARAVAVLAVMVAGAMAARSPAVPQVRVIRLAGGAFDPPVTHARAGDTLRFVNGNGGPHNVEFFGDSIPSTAKSALAKVMPGGADKLSPVASPLFLDPGETYVFVVPAIAVGRYPYFCRPHLAGNMKGSLFVDP